MTREEAKKLLPIIQAFAEGKTIQYEASDGWIDLDALYPHSDILSKYRIKPETKYRPFETQEECWHEMHKHADFGYIKNIVRNEIVQIMRISDEVLNVLDYTISPYALNWHFKHLYLPMENHSVLRRNSYDS